MEQAVAEAKKTGKPVEVLSQRGERRDVFATPDGKLEAREHLRAVRTRTADGWKPVDTDLAKTSDGAVAPKAVTVGLQFSSGGSAPLVRMTKAGRELKLSWPGTLPVPEVAGAIATYREVLPDVDLRMGAQDDGFTQLLVVKSAKAAANPKLAELRLKMAAEGMQVRETAEGGLEALDNGAKTPVFEASKPLMWDSSTAETAAPAGAPSRAVVKQRAATARGGEEPGAAESGKLAPVGVEVPSGGKELVLTPDAEVLKGKDTTYPVFIDPQWNSPSATSWTMVSEHWANTPQWKFNGENNAGMGYCDWQRCNPEDRKRLFYQVPISAYAGKSILSAEFVVANVHSASCSARGVELWKTSPIGKNTTWTSQGGRGGQGFWKTHLKTMSFAYGYEGCGTRDAEFDVRSAIQSAVNAKESSFTFGLHAADESDALGWKRFSNDGFLRMKYNQPPKQVQMSQLMMEYGGACQAPAKAPSVRSLGKFYVNKVTDPDGDPVSVQLQAEWDAGDGKGSRVQWDTGRSTAKPSGSSFYYTPPSNIPQNKQITWFVRSYDGAQYSPWSHDGSATACYFTYDKTVPEGPTITSTDYPASRPDDDDSPWIDGVGRYGAFQLKGADASVTTYTYSFNRAAPTTVTTTGGAAKTVNFLPSRAGLNFVTAQAFDQAGNGSAPTTFSFRVKAGQPERAAWPLDEAKGATQHAVVAPSRTVRLSGGAATGAAGKAGTALHLDGTTGYAVTDLSAVDTSGSYSVSAWAKLDSLPADGGIVATQAGNSVPGFALYYSTGLNRWVFNQYRKDATDAELVRAMAPAAGDAKAGQWNHLVGVYDSKAQQIRLYVDGKLAGSAGYTPSTPQVGPNWDARHGLQLGSAFLNGKRSSFLPGTLDDVQIFDRAVTADDVTKLQQLQPAGAGRPVRAHFPLDEAAGATTVTNRPAAQPLVPMGATTAGEPGTVGKALKLDGTTGAASTGNPVLNTARSYSLSTWVQLPIGTLTGNRTVASQSGTNVSPFYLSYQGGLKTWSLRTAVADAKDTDIHTQAVTALQPANQGTWTHLVAVRDETERSVRLYVNGKLQGSKPAPQAWEAGGPFQIGRALWNGTYMDYFPGLVDDVRVFDRPVADEEVQHLFRQNPVIKARWKLDTATGETTPDDAKQQGDLMLRGGAALDGSDIAVDNLADSKALKLDGKAHYADATTVPVDTTGSFTLTAWAKAAAVPDAPVSVLSAEGSAKSALNLRLVPDKSAPEPRGKWELVLPGTDAGNATVTTVLHNGTGKVTEWTHLAVVYDGFSKEASLYVNGVLQDAICGDETSTKCDQLDSRAENTLTYKAIKTWQVGRAKDGAAWGSYFPGVLDDVWAFQGALTSDQVNQLASQTFDFPTRVPSGT